MDGRKITLDSAKLLGWQITEDDQGAVWSDPAKVAGTKGTDAASVRKSAVKAGGVKVGTSKPGQIKNGAVKIGVVKQGLNKIGSVKLGFTKT